MSDITDLLSMFCKNFYWSWKLMSICSENSQCNLQHSIFFSFNFNFMIEFVKCILVNIFLEEINHTLLHMP